MIDSQAGLVPIAPLPGVMTQKEVAEFLRCEESTVKRYVAQHELKTIQVGKGKRFKAEDVWDFVSSRPSTARPKRRKIATS